MLVTATARPSRVMPAPSPPAGAHVEAGGSTEQDRAQHVLRRAPAVTADWGTARAGDPRTARCLPSLGAHQRVSDQHRCSYLPCRERNATGHLDSLSSRTGSPLPPLALDGTTCPPAASWSSIASTSAWPSARAVPTRRRSKRPPLQLHSRCSRSRLRRRSTACASRGGSQSGRTGARGANCHDGEQHADAEPRPRFTAAGSTCRSDRPCGRPRPAGDTRSCRGVGEPYQQISSERDHQWHGARRFSRGLVDAFIGGERSVPAGASRAGDHAVPQRHEPQRLLRVVRGQGGISCPRRRPASSLSPAGPAPWPASPATAVLGGIFSSPRAPRRVAGPGREREYDAVILGAGRSGENVADVSQGGLTVAIVEAEFVGGERVPLVWDARPRRCCATRPRPRRATTPRRRRCRYRPPRRRRAVPPLNPASPPIGRTTGRSPGRTCVDPLLCADRRVPEILGDGRRRNRLDAHRGARRSPGPGDRPAADPRPRAGVSVDQPPPSAVGSYSTPACAHGRDRAQLPHACDVPLRAYRP